MRFQTGYYFRKGIVVQKVGRNVYGSGDTIVKKTFRVSRWGRRGGACTQYFTVVAGGFCDQQIVTQNVQCWNLSAQVSQVGIVWSNAYMTMECK